MPSVNISYHCYCCYFYLTSLVNSLRMSLSWEIELYCLRGFFQAPLNPVLALNAWQNTFSCIIFWGRAVGWVASLALCSSGGEGLAFRPSVLSDKCSGRLLGAGVWDPVAWWVLPGKPFRRTPELGAKSQTCFPGQIKWSLGPKAQSGGGCGGETSRGKMLARVPEVMCCRTCAGRGQWGYGEGATCRHADFPAQVMWRMGRTFLRWGTLGECQLGARKRANESKLGQNVIGVWGKSY